MGYYCDDRALHSRCLKTSTFPVTISLMIILPFIIEPCQELCAVPICTTGFPVTIRPYNIRLITIYYFIQLWQHHFLQLALDCTMSLCTIDKTH